MADDSLIADLERRVRDDPASIAYAHLAEEYRRAGRLDDAIRVCRAGLARLGSYPSARVTLGRALFARGAVREARAELEAAAADAPDNVAVIRAVEEMGGRRAPAVPTARDTSLEELETWLEALRADRARRANASSPSDR